MNTLDKLYKKAKQISKDNEPYICMLYYNYVKNCIEQQYKECIILNIGGV